MWLIKDSAAAAGSTPAKGPSSPSSSTATLCGALSVLCDIVEHTSVEKLYLESAESPVAKLCQSCCYSSSLPVAARATQLLTLLAVQVRNVLVRLCFSMVRPQRYPICTSF